MTTLATLSDEHLLALLHVMTEAEDALAAGIRALSVRNEPDEWAGLIAAGIRPTENRVRRTRYRGPVLIHSSAYKAPRSTVRRVPVGAFDVPERLRLRGHVLALATISGCHEYGPGCCTCPWAEQRGGVFHWALTGVRALPEPIPASGRLGLWRPGRDLVADVLRQLREPADA